MLRNIVVGLEAGIYSTSAVSLALEWAKQMNARLTGVGIVDEAHVRAEETKVPPPSMQRHKYEAGFLQSAERQTDHLLDDFARRCAAAGVTAESEKRVGASYEKLAEAAAQADLIVLGRPEVKWNLSREFEETVSKVVKAVSKPVVVAPENYHPGEVVLVGWDGSAPARRAVESFLATGVYADRPIQVLSVGATRDEAASKARVAAELFRERGVEPGSFLVATAEPPAAVLLRQAREFDAGLLVLGAYGTSAVRKLFFGSVTESLLTETTIPLFLTA